MTRAQRKNRMTFYRRQHWLRHTLLRLFDSGQYERAVTFLHTHNWPARRGRR